MVQSALIEPLRGWDPATVGGFALIGRLGAGAMGQVYLGRSAAGRLVAVKTIRIEYAGEPDFRTRFSHEVAAARRVSGAFTAAVVAADPEADVPWLATAYVAAPSLSTLVRSCGPLPVPAVRWLAAGCAEALESIHAAGLVHRDLKPSNVLVSPDGPRVIDFGIAKAAGPIQVTLTHGAVGTPVFMAPEQARDSRFATTASDVYSLGATMLLAATGHGPYRGETAMDVLSQLATRPPDLSGLPGGLTEVVGACLASDPASRPTSASLLAYLAHGSRHDGALDLGPALLSGPARAMIAEYRRSLRPLAQPGADPGGDDTLGSLGGPPPAAAAAGRPAEAGMPETGGHRPSLGRHAARGPATAIAAHQAAAEQAGAGNQAADPAGAARAGAGQPGAGQPGADGAAAGGATARANPAARRGQPATALGRAAPRGRRALAGVAAGLAAVALLAAGTVVGTYLARGRAAGGGRGDAAAGRTDTGRDAAGGSPAGSARPARGTKSRPGMPASPPPGLPAPGVPPPPPPNVRARAQATGRPAAAVSQPFGDGLTIFVIMGAGFRPGARITICLDGVGNSPIHPRADNSGAFNYAINQGHEFFRGPLPPGAYTVEVKTRGVDRTVYFTVAAPPPSPAG